MKKTRYFLIPLVLIMVLCIVLSGCDPVEAATYTVTFDANGGTEVASVSVTAGGTVTAPVTTRDGYTFKAWTLNGTAYDFSTPVTENITLMAQWEAIEPTNYTVTFDTDGGTEVAAISVAAGGTVAAPVSTREGYTLTGWALNGAVYDFSTPVTGDITLKAQWEVIVPEKTEFTVSVFNYDGTKLGELVVGKGQSADLTEFSPTHKYPRMYTFQGWDKPLDNITQDTEVTAVYSYKSLPEELFNFTLLDDGTYEIAVKGNVDFRNLKLDGDYGIPENHNGKPVSRLGMEGLYSKYGALAGIDYLFIPESVKVVDAYAFKNLDIPMVEFAGVEEIYSLAFLYARFELVLPKTVKLIEPYAFHSFGSTQTYSQINSFGVTLDPECASYKQDGYMFYTADGKTLVFVDWQNMEYGTLTIPASVEKLYPALLFGQWNIPTVEFLGNIDTIGSACFYQSYSLNSVIFHGTVRCIEGSDAVYTTKGSATEANMKELRLGAFEQCGIGNNNDFVFPKGLEFIGNNAFFYTELSEIRLDGIKHIGLNAFLCNSYNKLDTIVVTNSENYYSYMDKALIERGTGPEYNGVAGDTFLLYAPVIRGFYEQQLYLEYDKYVIDTFVVPDGVTAFAPFAFKSAQHIKHLIIPEGVVSLPGGFLESSGQYDIYNDNWELEKTMYFGVHDISLPSTLKRIDSYEGADRWHLGNEFVVSIQVGGNFTGLQFPNGCNLEYISYCAMTCDNGKIVIPASVTDYIGNGIQGIIKDESIIVEAGNPKYVTFDGWLFEKLGNNELKLIQIPYRTTYMQETVTFPDTGIYTVTEIGGHAYRQNMYALVIPEGVKVIDDYAFFEASISEITLPASLESLGDYALGFNMDLYSLTFMGTEVPQFGKDVFAPMWDEPLQYVTIYAPNADYEAWYDAFRTYGDNNNCRYLYINLASPYSYTYRLYVDGAFMEETEGYGITSLPYVEKEGKYLLGWYTKDGTGGDWGERIDGYFTANNTVPYIGTPVDGIVNLYARFGDTKHEDGTEVAYAFDVSEATREITIGNWTTLIFEFKCEADGLYLLDMNFDHVAYYESGFAEFDQETNTLNISWPEEVYDEEWNVLYYGFRCYAGQTYYIVYQFVDQNVYTGETDLEGGTYEFTIVYQGELPKQEEWY